MFLRKLLLLCTISLSSCANDSDSNKDNVKVIDPESIVGKPPAGVPKYDNEQLIRVSGFKDKLRYSSTLGVIVSSSKASEVYENVIYLKKEALKAYKSSNIVLKENIVRINGFLELKEDWFYLNKNTLIKNNIAIHCSESYAQTEQQRKADSACFIRGKIGDKYFSYTIHHDDYLKFGEEIHDKVVKEIESLD